MTDWLHDIRWLPVVAVILVGLGFVLIIMDREFYQLATVLLLAAIVFAVLTGKETPK